MDGLVDVFHTWRSAQPDVLVDLADYRHVALGPALCLIGFEFNLVVETGESPAFVYTVRRGLTGDAHRRVRAAVQRSLEVMARLQSEPGYPGWLRWAGNRMYLGVADRLRFPNAEETDRLLKPAFRAVLDDLYGEGGYSTVRVTDPRGCYGCEVTARVARSVAELYRALSD